MSAIRTAQIAADVLRAFLAEAADRGLIGAVNFHTPNALNARLLTPAAAGALVAAGFRWHSKTAFPLRALGDGEAHRLKALAKGLNQTLRQ